MTFRKLFLSLILLTFLPACTTLRTTDDPSVQVSADPYQGFNKKVYVFNNAADKAVLKPLATGYTKVLPKPARKRVSLFFQNLAEPLNMVNNLLQGKVDRALSSTYRFVVNSTLGIGGLFDVAESAYDVKPAKEDFGQTLAAWGVKPGPYLVLPLFGPSNLRDGFGRLVDTAAYYPNDLISDSTSVTTGLTILNVVDSRANLLGVDNVLESQLNPYQFLKIAYEKNRLDELYDGSPPQVGTDDLDDF